MHFINNGLPLDAAHKQQKVGKAETEEQGIVSRLRCPFQCPHFCWFHLLQDPV